MIKGLVADFHENMDAVAAERAVDAVKAALLGDEALDAAVLVDMHRTVALRKGDDGP